MGPYEAAFFYESCRLSDDKLTPYRPIHPEITCTVQAVSEVLAEAGLPEDARALLPIKTESVRPRPQAHSRPPVPGPGSA